ncbi:MAG: PilZ domain-containing protein [Nitrospirae bacterium]|nr:PilZ domain-containing protein [Nitrospirota bacterium]
MITTKRKFHRIDLPLNVKFRPSHGAVEYATAVTKNISFEGLCLEAKAFNFIQYENLELNVQLPKGKAPVTLSGDVAWKKQVNGTSLVGIKLKMRNKDTLKKDMENILSAAEVPKDVIFSSDTEFMGKAEKKPVAKATVKKSISTQQAPATGLAKQYLKNGKCKVTFRLPQAAAMDAQTVVIAGDFNNWDTAASPMTQLKNGDFKITLSLDAGRDYRFRYLIDGSRWENDWSADRYERNDYGADDSVVVL